MANNFRTIPRSSDGNQFQKMEEEQKTTWIQKIFRNRQLMGLGDPLIFIMSLLLLIFSAMMVFSATIYEDPMGFMLKQVGSMIVGMVVVAMIRLVPLDWFLSIRLMNVVLVVVLILIGLTAVLGQEAGGATSWLALSGVNFQPSELFKLVVVLVIARIIAQFSRTYLIKLETSPIWRYYFPIACMLLSLLLIVLQPDFGGAMIIIGTTVAMLMVFWFAPINNLKLIGLGLIVYVLAIFLTNYFSDFLVNSNYHAFERFGSFVNPFNYAQSTGYQIINSYLAFSRGGLWGVGLGQGQIKANLPAAHTDFILAVVAEEFGLLGVVVVVGLLLALIFHLLRTAATMNIRFHRICLTGFAILLLLQMFVNVGGLSGLIPLTGVTLPFISYGGSSMIINLMMIGIVQKLIAEEKQMRMNARLMKTDRGGLR
ncbi:FtsW/RodA/SpoVE family cell cycle protein [Facklamia sp. DSM 111018]|uniref:Probable peptidoglycan glycosyltransferase FtsW n=1 Tax=Facklamia lactis TaxID=2749967 RepID=A0ABS0LRC7_9LACT|nr:FtsW/RodA/SpoVE family cell cycle protein [Facklamia lactis]MBG9986633.1 FtsW/RodA/SpoVE family cell cycle protein [Facklamia lactis]